MGFISPYLLPLVSLALVPLIIHLIQRIRLKKVHYSSLFFLTQTNRETFSWLQLKEILLLIFRTLFIFLLLFSLARPYLIKKIYISKIEASRLIILDDSYSMAYSDNFSRAKHQAQKLIQELKKGSEAALLTSSGNIKTALTTDFTELEKILDTINVSYSHKTLAQSYDNGLKLMTNAICVKKEIYIITDLQKRAVQPLLIKIDVVNQDSKYDISIIDVGLENSPNIGIQEIFINPAFPGPEFPSKPYVKIKNYSNKTSQRTLTFNLKFSDKESLIQSTQKNITLNPQEIKTIAIDAEIDKQGIYIAEASLSQDSIPADDRYYYAIKIARKNKVLLISDNPSEIRYIEKALQSSFFELSIADVKVLYQQNLKPYAVIGLFNPIKLTALDWQRITNYVAGGGGVFIAFDKEIQESQWTKILNLNFSADGKSVITRPPGFVSIKEVNYENSVMEIFRDINLTTAKFYSYWELNTFPESQVLAYFSSGKPFLMQGKNQKIISAFTAFDVSKTDFIFKATFLPLMHRLFICLSSPIMKTDYRVSDSIIFQSTSSVPLRIRTPNAEYLQTPNTENGQFIVRFTDTDQSGFYHLGDNVFTINIYSEEGNLSRITQAELKKHEIKILDKVGSKTSDFTNISMLLAILFFILELVLLTL